VLPSKQGSQDRGIAAGCQLRTTPGNGEKADSSTQMTYATIGETTGETTAALADLAAAADLYREHGDMAHYQEMQARQARLTAKTA
jgi:hypothetical protein